MGYRGKHRPPRHRLLTPAGRGAATLAVGLIAAALLGGGDASTAPALALGDRTQHAASRAAARAVLAPTTAQEATESVQVKTQAAADRVADVQAAKAKAKAEKVARAKAKAAAEAKKKAKAAADKKARAKAKAAAVAKAKAKARAEAAAKAAAAAKEKARAAAAKRAAEAAATLSTGADTDTAALRDYAAAQGAKRYGWDSTQAACLDALWYQESKWNPGADNPSSDAFGIPQALPGSKMASAGKDWATNGRTQIDWGLGYIKDRYGNPCNAWAKWQSRSPHWY